MLAHLNRMTKEKKTTETKEWLKKIIKDRPKYYPPKSLKPDQTVMAASKSLAARYFQLKMGHATTESHLKRINAMEDDRCWWCENEDRQMVTHLFKECGKWRRQRAVLRGKIPNDIWQHRGIEHLFVDRETTGHVLKFIESTEVGNRTTEKETTEREEERDDNWG